MGNREELAMTPYPRDITLFDRLMGIVFAFETKNWNRKQKIRRSKQTRSFTAIDNLDAKQYVKPTLDEQEMR